MSNYLERNIDLDRLQLRQDMAVSALNTISYLLEASATEFKNSRSFDPEEFAYGIAHLLKLLASDLNTNACDMSELVDQLRHEGVRP